MAPGIEVRPVLAIRLGQSGILSISLYRDKIFSRILAALLIRKARSLGTSGHSVLDLRTVDLRYSSTKYTTVAFFRKLKNNLY